MAEAFQIAGAVFGLSQILINFGKEVYEFTNEAPHVQTKLRDLARRAEVHRQNILCVKDVLDAWTDRRRALSDGREQRLLSILADSTTECSESAKLILNEILNIKKTPDWLQCMRRSEFIENFLLNWELHNNTSIPRLEKAIGEQQQAVQTLLHCLSLYASLRAIPVDSGRDLVGLVDEKPPLPSTDSRPMPERNQLEGSQHVVASVHNGSKSIPEAVDACREGNIQRLRSILNGSTEAGKSTDSKGGRAYLHHVIQYLDCPIAQCFVDCLVDEYGTDINVPSTLTGETPLHIAVKLRKVRLAEILVLKGANVDVKTKGGKTPLNLAAANGVDSRLMELLFQKRATCDFDAIK